MTGALDRGDTESIIADGKKGYKVYSMWNLQVWRGNRGFGLVEVLVAVVVLAIIGAGVYVYVQNQSSPTAQLNQEQKEAKEACSKAIDDELLCTSLAGWSSAAEEGMTFEMVGVYGGEEQTIVTKTKGDAMHSYSESASEGYEMIRSGSSTYMKVEDTWYVMPGQEGADETDDIASAMSSLVDDFSKMNDEDEKPFNYTRVGEEQCQDGPCVKYELTEAADSETHRTHLWVDKASARVVKMQQPGTNEHQWVATISYGNVTITPPTDAKAFPGMFE